MVLFKNWSMTSKMKQRTIGEFFQKTRGEKLALTDDSLDKNTVGLRNAGHSIPSNHNAGEIRRLRAEWENVNIVTYNIESTRGTRMQEMVVEAKAENVDILICIGTRGNYSGDGSLGEYKIFYEGHGEGGTEVMTGLAILIHKRLITKKTMEKKWVSVTGRILTVRLKNMAIDVTITGAYAPGDHLSRELRHKFWHQLDQNMRSIPRRSSRILGIDANGHIGRDGVGGIGSAGQERWTNNGHEMEKMTNNCRMVALNTLQNCREPGWTWQKRDGTGRGRIDYLLIDYKAQNLIKENGGAKELPKWGTQGSATDHRPVQARITVKTLQEKGLGQEKTKQKEMEGYSTRNRILIKAYEAHIKICENGFRVKQEEIGEYEQELVKRIQETMEKNIQQKWDPKQTANEMQRAIDEAMRETYDEICRERRHEGIKKRKDQISEETWEAIKQKNQSWAEVRKWWMETRILGWEQQINRYRMRIRNGEIEEDQAIKDMERKEEYGDGRLKEGWKIWNIWDAQRKKVRQQVTMDKKKYVQKCLLSVGTPEGPDNIWKAIEIIAPRNTKNSKALEKENGGICNNQEEEMEEVTKFCVKHLGQKEYNAEEEEREEKEMGRNTETEEPKRRKGPKPLRAEVREAFRHTHHTKSTPEWSVPTKMYVVAEEQLVRPIQQMWGKMGEENIYPAAWRIQKTVWIPKPGNKGNQVHKRRGITILDGGAKGYLVWLQKQMAAQMEKKNRRDEYGAVAKRSTAHALLKVLGVRNRLKKNKVSSITFLGDAVKAFDRIDRNIVLEETVGKLESEGLAERIVARHKTMVARTRVEDGKVDMKVVTGVAQGDPNGPQTYVNGYGRVLKTIEELRKEQGNKEMELKMPKWWSTTLIGGAPLNIKTAKTMYVDDHMEIHKIKPKEGRKHNKEDTQNQIRQILQPIFQAQEMAGVESGKDKTVIILELHGRGSQKVKKEMGGNIQMQDGRQVKIVDTAKYLGVRIGGKTEANEQEMDDRIKKANAAMNRLSQVWRNADVKTEEKIRIYQTLVTSLLLYATETRTWSSTQLARFEAVQMRHLRRIVKSPAHITLESNDMIRERTKTSSMTSQMQARRLKLWSNVAKNEVEEVVAVMWGQDDEKEHQLKKGEEEREKQLIGDIVKLMNSKEMETKQVTTNSKGETIMGKETWEFLKNLNKSHFKQLLGHKSEVEKRQKNTYGPKPEPKWKCTLCPKQFGTKQCLTSHVVHAHNQRSDQRKLVEKIQEEDGKFRCLICKGVYVNKKGAQLHIDRHCAKKHTQEHLVTLLMRHNLL